MTGISIKAGNQPLKKVIGILLIFLFVFNDLRLIKVVYEKNSIPVPLFVLTYCLAFLSLFLMLISKWKIIRSLGEILLFLALYTDTLYIILGDFPFSYPDSINLFNNPEYASSAIITFKTAFLAAFGVAAVAYLLTRMSIRTLTSSFSFAGLWLFVAIQATLFCYSKIHPGLQDFLPSVYRVTGNLLFANISSPLDKWRRAKVTEQALKRDVRHLFIVVDESVAGNALSINGSPVPTSPFLQQNAGKFINFGTANSFTNFSAGSNLSLMAGMLFKELPDKRYRSFSKANLFQYAKNAGYQTYLLDAQSLKNRLPNYTSPQDLPFIDTVFQPGVLDPRSASYTRDSLIMEKMAHISKLDIPTFTYVNKAGAHWPYSNSFPQDSLVDFLPGKEYGKSDNSLAYYKSLYWNVDKFWERLMRKLPYSENLLILYTSDHGENYASRSFRIKHASIYQTDHIEGQVPLFVLDKAHFFPEGFSPETNRYSHQYIFPTLLLAMGYNSEFVSDQYGRTLLEHPYQEPRWFQTGDLFGRGKNKRVYVGDPVN